jgi:hypothetical protein
VTFTHPVWRSITLRESQSLRQEQRRLSAIRHRKNGMQDVTASFVCPDL